MKKLNGAAFNEIRNWVYRNARPIDLALFQYHFESGSKDTVLAILSHYQNSDGGFGNAIDCDNWNPASAPYNSEFVLRILRQIGFLDTTHPICQGVFRYLENTEYKAGYGWFFTIPSNNDYPHAIWWDYNEQENLYQSIGTTASLSGFLLRYGDKHSRLYQMAAKYAKALIEKLSTTTEFGDMGIKGYCELLEDIEGAGLTEEFDWQHFCSRMHDMVRNKIDVGNFMANPLDFIPSPDSRFYEENRQKVEAALDQLIDQRQASGVWNIPWEWYNGNKYPDAFAISQNWWKSTMAIENILKLRRFGRLDF